MVTWLKRGDWVSLRFSPSRRPGRHVKWRSISHVTREAHIHCLPWQAARRWPFYLACRAAVCLVLDVPARVVESDASDEGQSQARAVEVEPEVQSQDIDFETF